MNRQTDGNPVATLNEVFFFFLRCGLFCNDESNFGAPIRGDFFAFIVNDFAALMLGDFAASPPAMAAPNFCAFFWNDFVAPMLGDWLGAPLNEANFIAAAGGLENLFAG